MIFQIGDKFIVEGILCEVRYIRHGEARVCPVEDTPDSHGRHHLACCVLAILDSKGRDRKGRKAQIVSNVECGAV